MEGEEEEGAAPRAAVSIGWRRGITLTGLPSPETAAAASSPELADANDDLSIRCEGS